MCNGNVVQMLFVYGALSVNCLWCVHNEINAFTSNQAILDPVAFLTSARLSTNRDISYLPLIRHNSRFVNVTMHTA